MVYSFFFSRLRRAAAAAAFRGLFVAAWLLSLPLLPPPPPGDFLRLFSPPPLSLPLLQPPMPFITASAAGQKSAASRQPRPRRRRPLSTGRRYPSLRRTRREARAS